MAVVAARLDGKGAIHAIADINYKRSLCGAAKAEGGKKFFLVNDEPQCGRCKKVIEGTNMAQPLSVADFQNMQKGEEARPTCAECKEFFEIDETPTETADGPMHAECAEAKADAAKAKAKKEPKVKTPKQPDVVHHFCLCGCGAKPTRKTALFVPGHDAKLKSILLKVERGQAEASTIPQEARDKLESCECCSMPMLPHESHMGPMCRKGECSCKARAETTARNKAEREEAAAKAKADREAKAEADKAAKANADTEKTDDDKVLDETATAQEIDEAAEKA